VHVVVAKNYQELVIDSEQDVLLEFYAPWCGHCKSLAPKYEELAALYKPHLDKVIIAKVDATQNDVPDEIQGFPTIKLFKAGSKDAPIDYSGSRSIEDLAKFISENGSHGINAYKEPEASEAVDTEGMPAQAAAATEKAKEGIKDKLEDAAEAVYEALSGDDDLDDHDEL
jgi:protein disulfide-isomerase A1